MVRLLFVFTLVFFTSCASSLETKSNYVSGNPLTIDIFAARGFLTGTNYERYYFDDNILWRECGDVTKEDNQKSDVLLPAFAFHPNLKLENTGKELLNAEEFRKISNTAVNLFDVMSEENITNLPPPESLSSLSNAGVFEIRINYNGKERAFTTSLDGINEGKLGVQRMTRTLFTLIRGVGPVICGSQTFFGIERR